MTIFVNLSLNPNPILEPKPIPNVDPQNLELELGGLEGWTLNPKLKDQFEKPNAIAKSRKTRKAIKNNKNHEINKKPKKQ